jgi:transposase-like protein
MLRGPRKNYTVLFKRRAVALVDGGATPDAVSRQLGVARQSVDNWRLAAARDGLQTPRVDATGRDELISLRADNLRLRQENELLRSALAARGAVGIPDGPEEA